MLKNRDPFGEFLFIHIYLFMFGVDLCAYSGLYLITAYFPVLPAVMGSHAPWVELALSPPEHLVDALPGQPSCCFSALPRAGLLSAFRASEMAPGEVCTGHNSVWQTCREGTSGSSAASRSYRKVLSSCIKPLISIHSNFLPVYTILWWSVYLKRLPFFITVF